MYKTLLLTACLALPFAAHAAEGKKPTPQQERMAVCSKEASAKKLKRDERNRFMSTCLSTKTVATAEQPAK
ncbi:MAG: hypothetical protein IPM30_06130 [Burkholderiales bacterium]|jgi:hypothetical protein|nr:hypothetical protein [Burkholderiales bacterium]